MVRNDWTREEISNIYHGPLLDLVYQAATIHRQYNAADQVQVCTLLSVKTGGCPEDCAYCPQAARYNTGLEAHKLMNVDEVLGKAREAKANGSTRFCMGAAWREVRDNRDFDKVLDMISGVNAMEMEVCCTMGMITEEQAVRMKEAGLHAYNHNLDTGESYYGDIITTRKYDDRLNTLANVRKAGMHVCSGGIIGMGESADDRIAMLHTLATLDAHPESVPVNALVPVEGTPLEDQPLVEIWEMVRMVATARILMPRARVRLSAGRIRMSAVEQGFLFLAGANSIFAGDKLLTTPNNAVMDDQAMFGLLGLNRKFEAQPVNA
jgi:biotin synthase